MSSLNGPRALQNNTSASIDKSTIILLVVLLEEIELNELYVHKKDCQNKFHVYNIPSDTAKK